MASDGKAEEWIEKAEKKLRGGFTSLFTSSSVKYEEAAEMYVKAANIFKMSKKFEQSGDAYVRAAECFLKLQSKHDAASNYISAANVLKKTSPQQAINSLKTAVELFTDEGRFSIAAKHQKEVAEIYEQEQDFEKAIEAYQSAADLFEGESSTSAANSCLLKVADFSAKLERYERSIEIYETVAKASLDNNLLKWSVKEYFLKAGLCHLATGDVVSTKRAIEKYQDMDPSFSNQRECKFLQDLLTAYENYDTEAFTQAVVDYDSISKLDQWKTTILLRIKNNIKNEDDSLA